MAARCPRGEVVFGNPPYVHAAAPSVEKCGREVQAGQGGCRVTDRSEVHAMRALKPRGCPARAGAASLGSERGIRDAARDGIRSPRPPWLVMTEFRCDLGGTSGRESQRYTEPCPPRVRWGRGGPRLALHAVRVRLKPTVSSRLGWLRPVGAAALLAMVDHGLVRFCPHTLLGVTPRNGQNCTLRVAASEEMAH